MIYIRTGLPGASKTLNSLKELVHSYEPQRPFYYHNIRLLILDFKVARSFSGWFYGWYFPNLKDASLKRKLIKIMKPIHDEDEFLKLEDVPFLRSLFECHNHFETWYYWVQRLYPKHHLKKLEAVIDGAAALGQDLTEDELFDLVEPLNFDFKHFEDPNFWFDLPKGSKILIDECQQFFPPRSVGSRVPQAIGKLETHRHGGYDLHFVTQDATLADQNLRKLVGRHIHFYNPFGGKTVTRKENPEVFNPKDYHQNKQATKKSVPHPKEFYGSYYSAEIHTHKRKLPKILILLLILPIFIMVMMYYVYDSLFADKLEPVELSVESSVIHSESDLIETGAVTPKASKKSVKVDSDLSGDAFSSAISEHLNDMTKNVFITGSNGVWDNGALVEYQYSFVRTTDQKVFDPTLAGFSVEHVGECLAIFVMAGVRKTITCDPFYKRVPVMEERRPVRSFRSDSGESYASM